MKRQKRLSVRLAVHAAAVFLFAACSMTALADAQGTVIPRSAVVRSSADTSSQSLMSVGSGQVVTITGQTTGTDGQLWYQVVNGNTTGYMRGDLLRVNGTVEGTAGNEATETQTSANIEPADAGIATVNAASVNVRSGPATSDSVVTSARRGTVMNILGQTTGADGNKWYQVTFNSNGSDVTGYVRYDVVEVSGDPIAPAEPEEGAEAPAEGGDAGEPDLSAGHLEVSNVLSSRILPLDVNLSTVTIDEAKLEEWASGNYYLLYIINPDDRGQDAYYLYTLSDKKLERIGALTGNEGQSSAGDGSLSNGVKIMIAILAVLVIALVIAVVILALRIREMNWDEELDDEDDDFYGDDTNDDIEEGRVNSSRWRPRNFLQTDEEADDEDVEDDEDEEADEDDLEEYEARLTRKHPGAQGNAGRPQAGQGRPGARPQPGQRAPQRQPQAGERVQRAGAAPQGQRRAPGGAAGQPQGERRAPGGAAAGQPQGERRTAGGAAAQQRPGRQNPAQPQAGASEREPGRRPAPSAADRGEPRRGAAPEERQRNVQQQRPAQKPQTQPAYAEDDDEDDEFEFEFLNMDGKEDL